jgi:hypothetical protein
MAKAWSFNEACRLAGELYGNILARNSDPVGFNFTVDQLNSGRESVRDVVKRFLTSEEFREKFVMNQTPNELAQKLLSQLCRKRRLSPQEIKAVAVALTERDWRGVVEELVNGASYSETHGEDHVPLWA